MAEKEAKNAKNAKNLKDPKDPKDPKNAKNEMLEAAALLAEGKTAAEAAKILGRAESTIRRWMRDDTAREAYREAILRTALVSYARAVKKLSDQVDADNETVAQRAAKDLIDRFGDAIMQEQEREIVVRVVGAPEIGMPEEPQEEDE